MGHIYKSQVPKIGSSFYSCIPFFCKLASMSMIFLKNYFINTTAEVDVVSIIHEVNRAIKEANAAKGLATIMVTDPGGAITILEPLPELVDQFKEALEIDPNDGATYYNLAIALLKQKQWRAARKNFAEAIKLRVNELESLTNIGVTLREEGLIRESIDTFESVLEKHPYYEPAKKNLQISLRLLKNP